MKCLFWLLYLLKLCKQANNVFLAGIIQETSVVGKTDYDAESRRRNVQNYISQKSDFSEKSNKTQHPN